MTLAMGLTFLHEQLREHTQPALRDLEFSQADPDWIIVYVGLWSGATIPFGFSGALNADMRDRVTTAVAGLMETARKHPTALH